MRVVYFLYISVWLKRKLLCKNTRDMLNFSIKLLQRLVAILAILVSLALISAFGLYFYYFPQLPSVTELQQIQLKTPIRIYSREDKLIAEFGQYRRRLLHIESVPQLVTQAFISIEDTRFYQHQGVDFFGIARAISVAMRNKELSQGASTITMQLARNYFLTSERTLSRKIKEIFLATKIENNFTKSEILELYLNKIFLGKRAYGVGAAAEVYYGKKLDQLTLAQIAMIAGLPKAPTRYNPINNPQRAKLRRDYILQKMLEQHYINLRQYAEAVSEPISAKIHVTKTETYAPYMAEMVRAEVIRRYGHEAYKLGLNIYTTLDSNEQALATTTLRHHLQQYSHRHGYRGAENHVNLATFKTKEQQADILANYKIYADLYPALVITVDKKQATLRINQQTDPITLRLPQVRWARRYINEDQRGKKVQQVSDVLKAGDIVRIQKNSAGQWQLTQIPRVTGALVSLDPNDGAIRAITGGFAFSYSKFNRAIQAKRQPGSSFKPFIYSAALAKGFSPASIVNDAPFKQAGSSWNPQNFGHKFDGLMRLRVALAKSKNMISIHLLKKIGIDYAIDYASKFGFQKESLPHNLTIALGTGSASPLRMATAYASFANGGYKVNHYFIRKIEDKNHQQLFTANPKVACTTCQNTLTTDADNTAPEQQVLPTGQARPAERIMQPYVNYQITSMLQSVAKIGTAARAGRELQRPDIAGKTGTTNDQKDAWFCGFTPKKVTTVWIGFDHSQSLGKHETSTKAALPVWIDFMKVALKESEVTEFPRPQELIDIKLDAKTGSRPTRSTTQTIIESLIAEQIPSHTTRYNVQTLNRDALEQPRKKIVVAQQPKSHLKAQHIKNKNKKLKLQQKLKQKKKWQRLQAKKVAKAAARKKRQRLNKKRRQLKKKRRQQRRAQLKRRNAKKVARRQAESVEIPEQLF